MTWLLSKLIGEEFMKTNLGQLLSKILVAAIILAVIGGCVYYVKATIDNLQNSLQAANTLIGQQTQQIADFKQTVKDLQTQITQLKAAQEINNQAEAKNNTQEQVVRQQTTTRLANVVNKVALIKKDPASTPTAKLSSISAVYIDDLWQSHCEVNTDHDDYCSQILP